MVTIALMTESLAQIGCASLTLGAWSPVLTNLLVGGFLIVSIAMILLILIQRPQGGGLSGAFGAGGGGGAGQTAFGTKTGDVLTFATITIFVCFLVFAIVLNFATRPHTAAANPTLVTAPQGAAPVQESGDDADAATQDDQPAGAGVETGTQTGTQPGDEAGTQTGGQPGEEQPGEEQAGGEQAGGDQAPVTTGDAPASETPAQDN